MPPLLTILIGVPGAATPWPEAVRTLVAGREIRIDDTAAQWPFRRTLLPPTGSQGPVWVVPVLHEAFPAGQTGAARLVLTQSTYQLQRCLDWLSASPGRVMIGAMTNPTADTLRDARTKRGPWSRIATVEVATDTAPPAGPRSPLVAAFHQTDAERRFAACTEAVRTSPGDAAARLGLASAAMETGRLDEAEEALITAVKLAPDWEAVHYEFGKQWLRRDDTARAAGAFAEAARLMPSFAAAHANLGAALGELEQPEQALIALETAAALDPFGHTTHNNIGASLRDLGRLDEAERSFRRVIALAPHFVFGHYNLGHALFLQGRFGDARLAYEAGLARDPAQTPRQRLRLALTLAALDDATPSVGHARAALEAASDEVRPELLDEMEEVLRALTALRGERRPAIDALEQVVGDYRAAIPRS
jgi:tetratricopeptide (TPR) repeat protein